ncbi:Glu-tRNA(Gln) amidotransferase subunit GatE [Candidatus Woesearchaeota archaeon]|nr:Glu-tRNA(Gln) amidotransferase subunit GatE [Candidatus Woesearchaeota archaeon]
MRSRNFVYEGYSDSTCLLECDEEPPHKVNQEALISALQLSIMVKANPLSVVQFMRKTIVDGSNTSGFQRTALVGRNGSIETSQGAIRIDNINLEEDACKIVSETSEEKIYRLDRLGIPLIEIGTAPDIHSPEQCQEAAKKIGMLLRSLPNVKRGLGTIRQDINVSISGGPRIEIKGFQDLKLIPLAVELEVKRQVELLKIKDELRGVRLDSEFVDLSSTLLDTQSKILRKCLDSNGTILGFKLNNFTGYFGRELQPGYRLGTEFSGRAKAKAGVGGIFHSDELPNYGITELEVLRIRKKLRCERGDGFVIVADTHTKSYAALEAVHERAKEALLGIPPEVRKANTDGTTAYLRPIPGAARMYPETDVPLIKPDLSLIEIPELLEEKIKRFNEKLGLSLDLATFVARSDQVSLFDELVARYPLIKPAFIAETLVSMPLEIKRKYALNAENLTESHFRELFNLLSKEKIHKDIVLDVLIDMLNGTFNVRNYELISTEALERVIRQIIESNKDAPMGALMGICMKELSDRASGKVISDLLKRLLGK